MKLFVLAGMASLSCAAVIAACGSSSNKGSGGGGGDGGNEGDGKVGDGGSSSGGGAKPYAGTLTATRTIAGMTTVYTVSGGFVATPDVSIPDASAAATCPATGTVSGSCCYVAAPPPSDAGAADAGTVTFDSAGTITVDDGTTAIASLMPGMNGAYGITSGANNPSVKWTAGDTLNFSATGGAVGAFTGSLVTVVDFAGVTPALSYTTATTVPLTADLDVKWTPGTGTDVRLFLAAAKGTTVEAGITCDSADSSGAVTVPMALLSKLATGDTGVITLTRSNLTTATDANTTVDLLSTTSTGGTAKFQ